MRRAGRLRIGIRPWCRNEERIVNAPDHRNPVACHNAVPAGKLVLVRYFFPFFALNAFHRAFAAAEIFALAAALILRLLLFIPGAVAFGDMACPPMS